MKLRNIVKNVPFAKRMVWFLKEKRTHITSSVFLRKNKLKVSGGGTFILRDKRVKASVSAHPDSHINLTGNLIFQSDLGEIGSSHIIIDEGATLTVHGDFVIGPNVTIILSRGARLTIDGKRDSSGSGITGATKIMVMKEVKIGADSIISWDVFITDCDWHYIHERSPVLPTFIGNKVWIAHGVSILKGSIIGNGSIVAAHSLCANREYPPNALLAGSPARVAREGVQWSREMPTTI
jgi:acetyltransferase-like isoleucine patch superfamily enzyme